jgi:hypothetical protein
MHQVVTRNIFYGLSYLVNQIMPRKNIHQVYLCQIDIKHKLLIYFHFKIKYKF